MIDPKLITDDGADILKALQDLGAEYQVKELPLQSCIGWMREKVEFNVGENSQVIDKGCFYLEGVLRTQKLCKNIKDRKFGLHYYFRGLFIAPITMK